MKFFKNLTVQVVTGIILGILVGYFFPDVGSQLKVLADWFIKLIKMVIAPIIFFTVVIGIGGIGDMKKIGRIGGKALLYFEIVSTFALAIGILVANTWGPGNSFNMKSVAGGDISQYTTAAAESEHGAIAFISSIIPENAIAAMAGGQLLPILFFAILFGLALAGLGEKGKPVVTFISTIS